MNLSQKYQQYKQDYTHTKSSLQHDMFALRLWQFHVWFWVFSNIVLYGLAFLLFLIVVIASDFQLGYKAALILLGLIGFSFGGAYQFSYLGEFIRLKKYLLYVFSLLLVVLPIYGVLLYANLLDPSETRFERVVFPFLAMWVLFGFFSYRYIFRAASLQSTPQMASSMHSGQPRFLKAYWIYSLVMLILSLALLLIAYIFFSY